MKLKTSFFNKTVLKKDVTRFAPLWGLYTVFMLLFVFLLWADDTDPARFAAGARQILMGMGIVNFVYAGLCAVLLFGDLFSSKMCNALHAMPLRREGWFLTHFTAGLLFCVGPNALGALVASMILQEYCYLAFIWLAVMLCQFLFFFGVGAFSVQCAGNRLGATAVYGLFNFLAVLAAFLVDTFYEPVLYGIQPDLEKLCRYSPVVNFTLSPFVTVNYSNSSGTTAVFEGFVPENWRYLFIALAVGLLLLGAAVLLYRRRQMESAGDFIAVKAAAPVFLVIYTLCVGAVLYFIADLIGTAAYLFLIIGFAIGFFTGWMLLEKKVNVFKPKKFLGLGILTLVFFLTISLTWMDPLGITRYVPQADRVQSVAICPYASDYYLETRALTLTEPEDIEKILAVHSDLVENRIEGDSAVCLRLQYTLKGGATVDRQYYVDSNSESAQVLKTYFSDFRLVTQYADVDALLDRVESVEFYSHTSLLPNIDFCTPAEQAEWGDAGKYNSEDWVYVNSKETGALRGLLEAIHADCEAGNMAQQWDLHGNTEALGSLTICVILNRYQTEYLDITVFGDCANTELYLKSLCIE